jgi:hypothetical protein
VPGSYTCHGALSPRAEQILFFANEMREVTAHGQLVRSGVWFCLALKLHLFHFSLLYYDKGEI